MAVYKISIEDFDEIDYLLIAIHTSVEDYKLAYKLNQELGLSLCKNIDEIPVEYQNESTFFTRFTFEDEDKMSVWNLIQNKQEIQTKVETPNANLFENKKISARVLLLKELKKVDFLLKIEQEQQTNLSKIIKKISKIDAVSSVYQIETATIKSKNNLIF